MLTNFELGTGVIAVKLENECAQCWAASNRNACNCLVFTALHVMQTRYSDENSVRPSARLSVCPSVCHTRGL